MKKKFEKIGKSLNKDEQKKVSGKGRDHCNGIPCINPMTGQYQCWETYCTCGSFGYCTYFS
jgi:hypothetical protein